MIETAQLNIEEVRMKQCTKCKEIKPFSEFSKADRRKFGLASNCKECRKQHYQENEKEIKLYKKEYREKNKEKIKERDKRYYQKTKEKRIEYARQYKLEHKERLRESSKQYYHKNKDRIREYKKLYCKENKERKKAYNKKYCKENKERKKAYDKQYYEDNKERIREQKKQYYEDNKEQLSEQKKQYYERLGTLFPEGLNEKQFCQECDKELNIRQIRCQQLYCSKKCFGLANRKPEAQVLRKYFRGYNWQFKRKIIRERDNYTCQICGEEENGLEHDVHHIIPYHSFGEKLEANRESNLITLCQSCHRKHEDDNSFIPIFLRIVEENEMLFLSKIKQREMIES